MLLKEDALFLEQSGYQYEVKKDRLGNVYVIIKDFPLPKGYTVEHVQLLVIIPILYPIVKLDCFYVQPTIAIKQHGRKKAIRNALMSDTFFGMDWQIVSRHMPYWKWDRFRLRNYITFIRESLEEELSEE